MVNGVGQNIERYMDLLSARQKLVAGNIANADTPGYKTKDIDFNLEYLSALSGEDVNVINVPDLITKNDGNNVSIDRESRMLSENALRFTVASNLLRAQYRSVKIALGEGK